MKFVLRYSNSIIFLTVLLVLSSSCGQIVTLPPPVFPTETPSPKPLVFPTPPPGWTIHTKNTFQIALPVSWTEVTLDEVGLKNQIQAAESNNPHLADTLSTLLDRGLYKNLAFYAVDAQPTNTVTNVTIAQRTVTQGTTVEQLAKDYVEALPQLIKGAKVVNTQAPMEINGLSAADIDYDVPLVNAGGQLMMLRGVQFLFLLDSGDSFAVTITGNASDGEKFMNVAQEMGRSFVGVRP